MQGFEVVLLNRTTFAIKAFTKRKMEDARNLSRIALRVLLVRAVNNIVLAAAEFHGLLPPDDPLVSNAQTLNALARSTAQWAKSPDEKQ